MKHSKPIFRPVVCRALFARRRLLGSLGMLALLMPGMPARAWDDPLALTLNSQPMRSLSLPGDVDPRAWANRYGMANFQRHQGYDGRQYLNFRADDVQWQQIQAQCDAGNPLAAHCDADTCQAIRGPFQVSADLTEGSQAWLVPRAPDLQAVLAGEAADCPADSASGPQPVSGAAGEGIDWPEGRDPACWTLLLSRPCRSEQTPAEYLQPHWQADQLLVLLPGNGEAGGLLARRLGLKLIEEYPLQTTGERLLRLARQDRTTPLDAWVERLRGSGGVLQAQKDFAYFTLAEQHPDAAASSEQRANGDPLGALNYAPKLTGSEQLAERYQGQRIRVALIDTGLDQEHPELQHAIAEQRDFTGKGYASDAHGTAVGAIIAGARNNGVGAYGIAPEVRLHSFKACQPRHAGGLAAQCWSSSLVKALDAAGAQGLNLINLSLGGPPSPLLHHLIRTLSIRGALILAAAGNGGPNARPIYPAAWPETLAVTAIDAHRNLYAQANRGTYIQIAAPGVDIITAGPRGAQPILSGTSLATAHATGLAALLTQLQPAEAPQTLAKLLESAAEDLGPPGPDPEYGAGLLDACRSAGQLRDVSDLCRGGSGGDGS